MAMVYSIADLCNVTWQGDAPDRVSRFEDRWDEILDTMSTKLDDDTLRDFLLEQMGTSKELESEVKAYERGPDLRTYAFLTGCLERCLSNTL